MLLENGETNPLTAYQAKSPFPTVRNGNWRAPTLVIAACLVLSVPIFLTAMPPVMDFPNHLTRIWLLAGGADAPPLSAMYEVRWWQASTNLAVDFIGALLTGVAGITAAKHILLAMMFVGPPLGAAFLNRAVFGRFHAWQLAGVMLAWGTTAVEGFLSFQIGLAAALFFAAAATPLVERLSARALIVTAIAAAVLLLIHPFALLFFTACIIGLDIGENVPTWRTLMADRGRRIIAFGAAGILPLVLLYLLAPDPPGVHGVGTRLVHFEPILETLRPKQLALLYLSPFLSYRVLWDIVLIAPLAALVTWAAWRGHLRFHAGLLMVAAAMLLVAPFLPTNIGDGGALPIRFPIMAGLLAIAGTRPVFALPRTQNLVAAVVAVIALARTGYIGWVWHERAADIEQLRTVAQDIPPGASVLILQQKWRDTTKVPIGRLVAGCPGNVCAAERHFGSLLVFWRQAFVPTLFAVPGQHPLAVRTPWWSKSVVASGIPFADEIPSAIARDPYLARWHTKFDYVVLLDADLGRTPLPGVQLLRDSGFARLYRVEHPSGYARNTVGSSSRL